MAPTASPNPIHPKLASLLFLHRTTFAVCVTHTAAPALLAQEDDTAYMGVLAPSAPVSDLPAIDSKQVRRSGMHTVDSQSRVLGVEVVCGGSVPG